MRLLCALSSVANPATKPRRSCVQTTLLKVLAGKHMVGKEMVNILGSPPFYETHLTTAGQLSYIGGNWERDVAFAGYSIPLAGDFPASQMLDSIHHVDPARRKKLIEVLDIDEEWRMHLVSDGQRRRVQIACGLLKPADVLLLDEVTVRCPLVRRFVPPCMFALCSLR